MSGSAKRHHWIPRFLLSWFSADPTAKNPLLVRLDKQSGRTSTSSVTNEAVIGQFNRLDIETEGPRRSVEEDWATIEAECKPALDKVLARQDLTQGDAELIFLFAVLQHRRTPRMRQWGVELIEPLAQVAAELKLGEMDRETIRAWLQSRQDEPVTDARIEQFRSDVQDQLRDQQLEIRASADHEVLLPFVASDEVALQLSRQMSLTCLRTPAGAEFILGDHPVSIVDRTIPRDEGVGWLSSPDSRVTFPISRSTCLEFRPGPPGYRYLDTTVRDVDDINLRSYAHAQWAIWGSAPRWVQETRRAAKLDKGRIASYEPRKMRLVFFERMEGAPAPHNVVVHQPQEPTVRGFIRRRSSPPDATGQKAMR